MSLFKRKAKPESIVLPDGVEYVAVEEEKLDEILVPMCQRVDEIMESPISNTVSSALITVLPNVVRPQAAGDGPPPGMMLAATAARLGYSSRIVEFELLEADDWNSEVADFQTYALDAQKFGDHDFQNLVGCVGTMMNAAKHDPHGEQNEMSLMLQQPRGLGPYGRDRMAAMIVSNLMHDPEAEDERLRDLEGVEPRELKDSYLFGYWLRACEASLPDAWA